MKEGARIKLISFPAESIDGASTLIETDIQKLTYHEQNLGEYGVGWIIVTRDGQEIGRHNIKYIESIILP